MWGFLSSEVHAHNESTADGMRQVFLFHLVPTAAALCPSGFLRAKDITSSGYNLANLQFVPWHEGYGCGSDG
jgi:hypothetical protein